MKRILLIEDERKINSFISRNLADGGYSVDSAYDGASGLKKAFSTRYDLILLDTVLPKKDGITVIRELKANSITAHIPVVFITAKAETSDIVLGLELGADDYIVKPFAFAELVARVNRFFINSRNRVERYLEFPSELYLAGLGILNYFGTYLRQRYPEQKVNIKVEQYENSIKLIIETSDGRTDIIERALYEYGSILSGQNIIELHNLSDKLQLEINNELRIAKFRIEAQKDIISIQNDRIEMLNNRIDKLMSILENGFSNKQSISIDFKPQITASFTQNNNMLPVLDAIAKLKKEVGKSKHASRVLRNIELSISSIQNEQDPNIVKNSSAMSVLRKTLDGFSKKNTALKKAIDATETGMEVLKDLATNYNKIAQWCGLPQVPSIFCD